MFEMINSKPRNAVIKVIGVGGGGGNAVEHMLQECIEGVEFICANTDAQTLECSNAKTIIQLGETITKGLGAGADPDIGRRAAEEDKDRMRDALEGADMVFITAGMGGGTGTGAAPVIAELARSLGLLTVAVVTKPFSHEGRQRMQIAEEGISALASKVDSLITIPNDKLIAVLGNEVTLLNAFKAANNVLHGAVKGIADLIMRPGLINVDFADVRTIMLEMGMSVMGSGVATGENRARVAAEAAISSPLLEDVDLRGARGILINISAGLNLTLGEFKEVGDIVKGLISDDAKVVIGTVIDPELNDEVRVTVIVTGLTSMKGGNKEIPLITNYINHVSHVNHVENIVKKEIELDYNILDRPSVLRKTTSATPTLNIPNVSVENEFDTDYLDIPTFLRKKKNT